jgi:hypothetical protein
VSTQRFAVEFDRRVVGIAVRVPGGFMFFASDDDFERLDGEIFPRARAIARRLEKVSKRRGVKCVIRTGLSRWRHPKLTPLVSYPDRIQGKWK